MYYHAYTFIIIAEVIYLVNINLLILWISAQVPLWSGRPSTVSQIKPASAQMTSLTGGILLKLNDFSTWLHACRLQDE